MMVEEVNKQTDLGIYETLDMFLKLMCINLHNNFQFTEDDLICFVGSVKNALRWNKRLLDEGTQKEIIDQKMSEIFTTIDYPQEWVDKLIKPDDGGK